MGQPVKIVDLAERMIRLSGLEPGRDIEIAFTGMRPGERLHEILFAREEPIVGDRHRRHRGGAADQPTMETMQTWLATLEQGLSRGERSAIYRVLRDAVPDFRARRPEPFRARPRARIDRRAASRPPAACRVGHQRAADALPLIAAAH